jgi:hypothetical protein
MQISGLMFRTRTGRYGIKLVHCTIHFLIGAWWITRAQVPGTQHNLILLYYRPLRTSHTISLLILSMYWVLLCIK